MRCSSLKAGIRMSKLGSGTQNQYQKSQGQAILGSSSYGNQVHDTTMPERGVEWDAAFTRQDNIRIISLPAEAGVPWG